MNHWFHRLPVELQEWLAWEHNATTAEWSVWELCILAMDGYDDVYA